MKKKIIDDIVLDLVNKVGTNNISDILDYLDIKIIKSTSNKTFFLQTAKEKYIFLSNTVNENIKNFVIAHEIGHALLHDVEIINYSKLSINKSIYEREADYFAFKLLNKEIDPLFEYTKEQYANLLGVNEEVLEYIVDNK
ncbi:ImmA/IrrE family metallo-endopeptidase [Helcococcus ovis]|uniref:ImmA/IrrE family metallo-endopeptidase n=1 Tax=Helcococcus TaxID=31983 RepID=UPI0038B6E077